MQEEKEVFEIDYLGSAEFDITEGIKDLVANIKSIKNDVDLIKEYLNFPSEDKKPTYTNCPRKFFSNSLDCFVEQSSPRNDVRADVFYWVRVTASPFSIFLLEILFAESSIT